MSFGYVIIEQTGVSVANWNLPIIPFFQQDMDLDMGPDGARATRGYLVPWGLLQQVAQQFLGYPFMATAADGSPFMARHLPQPIEFIVDEEINGFMWADRVRIKPLGGGGFLDDNSIAASFPQHYRKWDHALMTVEYTTRAENILTLQEIDNLGASNDNPTVPGFDDEDQQDYPPGVISLFQAFESNRYVVWNDDNSAKFAITENANWKILPSGWPDGPLPVPTVDQLKGGPNPYGAAIQSVGNKLGVPYAEGHASWTWFEVCEGAFDPVGLDAAIGTTNIYQFYEYAPGTLIFTGWKRKRRRSALGQRIFNLEFSALKRPRGVNNFLYPGKNTYGQVVSASDGSTKPIIGSDFNIFFLPPG